ncbi:hypothetical protein MTP99_007628 [Tenebrio molitor]|nr:hypothetical protein MTP99_007628 [Tenebrio molitor]
MDKVQRRMALSTCGAYKTTATETASVLSSLIPLDLLAEERGRMKKKPTENERALERETTINKWQTRWEQQTTSLWTHLIMPDIRPWVTRKYGSVSFRMTQMLSGHGCFVAYLHRIGRSETAECWFCGGERDDAEHTLIACERWKSERAKFRKKHRELDNIESHKHHAALPRRLGRDHETKRRGRTPERLTTNHPLK